MPAPLLPSAGRWHAPSWRLLRPDSRLSPPSVPGRAAATASPPQHPRRFPTFVQHPRNLLAVLLAKLDMHPMVGSHACTMEPIFSLHQYLMIYVSMSLKLMLGHRPSCRTMEPYTDCQRRRKTGLCENRAPFASSAIYCSSLPRDFCAPAWKIPINQAEKIFRRRWRTFLQGTAFVCRGREKDSDRAFGCGERVGLA
jgi:hypothetical protein